MNLYGKSRKRRGTLSEAHRKKDYAKAMAIEAIMYSLEDYRALCSKTIYDNKHCEDEGGRWKNGVCILDGPNAHETYDFIILCLFGEAARV